jgi:hypothetical protein
MHKVLNLMALVGSVSACGAPAEDLADGNPTQGAAGEQVKEVSEAVCSSAEANKIRAAYMRAFGRFADQEEGAQWGGELAYWCAVAPGATLPNIMLSHENWMKGTSSQQNLTRRNTILRSYRRTFGRTGVIGNGAFDINQCEFNYWDSYLRNPGADAWEMNDALRLYAQGHGYGCSGGHTYDSYTSSTHRKWFYECGAVPFQGC